MTSTSESTQRSRPVSVAAVVTHGRKDLHGALEAVRALASGMGVALVDDPLDSELTVVLGGDGTMLRTLARVLGRDVPVIGVHFGRVGFLASIAPDDLERDLARVFRGEYIAVALPSLEVTVAGARHAAVNDVVVTSGTLGRMVEIRWAVGGEDLGMVPCDGMIVSTPSGSTAYNLSNGGPVLVRGLDAMAVTFIAPHSLHARPLVVPRGLEVTVENLTPDVELAVLVDGHLVAGVDAGDTASVGLCGEQSLLAMLPETTFFGRYRETFSS